MHRAIRAWLLPNEMGRERAVKAWAAQLPVRAFVVDVGAGTQPYRHYFSRQLYLAMDLKDGCEDQALPFDTDTVDAVLCTEVLEHVPDPVIIMNEIARVLKPGGVLLVTAPLGSGVHNFPQHYYGGFSPAWYRRWWPTLGLDVTRCEPNGGFWLWYGQETYRAWSLLLGRWRCLCWPLWAAQMSLCHLLHWLQPMPDFAFGFIVEGRRHSSAR